MNITYGGIIEREPGPSDWILGATTKLAPKVLQADRNWLPYKPTKENQRNDQFDTYGCVTFSRNNCIEIMEKRKFGTEFNRSDRFLVVASGTTPMLGNYLDKVAETGRKAGAVAESKYPFLKGMTQSEYYQAIPSELYEEAKGYLKLFKDNWEWVTWAGANKDKMWEALQYSPLQVTMWAYGPRVDGVYMDAGMTETNHAVTLMAGEYGKWWKILDQYDNEIKTLDWSVYFGSAMRHNIEKNMLKLIKGDAKAEVYVVGNDGLLRHIYSEGTFNEGKSAGFWGDWADIEVKPQAEVDAMPKGKDVGFLI